LAPTTETDIRCFPDVAAVQEAIAAQRPSERLILIKGSNSTKLHQLPELL
jgi:UDP-N-acetylmuramoyl-tripeptide--D-alanyl-D-alanine ligase